MAGPSPAQVLREFGSLRGPKPEDVEREFGIRIAPAQIELPEIEPRFPPGTIQPSQALRAGEAGFGAPAIPPGFSGPSVPEPSDLRTLTEGLLSGGGEAIGARFGGTPGAAAGSAAGGFAGSLLSETFDPTTEPLTRAFEVGATSAAITGVFAGGVRGLRALLGQPNEAAKLLIRQAEKRGELPSAAVALPDSALLSLAQSVGQADVLLGREVTRSLERSRGIMTDETRQFLNAYLRTKMVANNGFRQFDQIVGRTLGLKGVAKISDDLFEAAEPLLAAWKRQKLEPKLDSTLIPKIDEGLARIRSKGAVKFETPELTIAEIQSLGDRFRLAAQEARRGTAGAKNEIGGMRDADAFTRFAREAERAMDDAIETQIKNGTLPLAARVELRGAQAKWKQWKSGSLMRDKLISRLNSAGREGGPINSSEVFSAISEIEGDVAARSVSEGQKVFLTKIARAMKLAETSEKQKMFTWVVRAGQLGVLMNQASVLGGGPGVDALTGQNAFIVLAPATLAWLTTNKQAVGWMIRGMNVRAGTSTALRLGEQLVTAMLREGLFPPDRAHAQGFDVQQEFDPSVTRNPLEAVPLRPAAKFRTPRPPVSRNPSFPNVNPTFVPNLQPATILPERAGAPRG